jgi:hypothetical protein
MPPSLLNDNRSPMQIAHDARRRAAEQLRPVASNELKNQRYEIDTPKIVGHVYETGYQSGKKGF